MVFIGTLFVYPPPPTLISRLQITPQGEKTRRFQSVDGGDVPMLVRLVSSVTLQI